MVMYLGRYGHQSARDMMDTPTVQLRQWMNELSEMLNIEYTPKGRT